MAKHLFKELLVEVLAALALVRVKFTLLLEICDVELVCRVFEHHDIVIKLSVLRANFRAHPEPVGQVRREGSVRQYAGLVVDVQAVGETQSSINLLQRQQ